MAKAMIFRTALVLFLLAAAMPLMAQIGPDNQDDWTPCYWYDANACFGDDANSGTTTNLRCSDSYGCPQCALTNDMKSSICYRIFGNYGYCSCAPNGTYTDKHGILRPRCTTQGACSNR